MGPEATVVTVFPDDNKKYLSTDLLREEPREETFHAPHVELLGFRAFKRVCHTCCEPDDCNQRQLAEQIDQAAALPPCPVRDAPNGG
jgi:cysteine synthase A